jgi:hypothetical protein
VWHKQESHGLRSSVRVGSGFGDFLGLREKAFFLHVMHGAARPW